MQQYFLDLLSPVILSSVAVQTFRPAWSWISENQTIGSMPVQYMTVSQIAAMQRAMTSHFVNAVFRQPKLSPVRSVD